MELVLSARLSAAADFVRKNRLTADVGTDHGYLPAFLVLSKKTSKAIASDIGVGPLENAEKTVRKYALEDNISLILSNGLKNIPHNVEDIVIAGMGGTLIVDILSEADWVKSGNIHLVLQPMTHSYDVRKYLCENGFFIEKETTCRDEGRVYVVLSAYYGGGSKARDDYYYYLGDTDKITSETDRAYINKQLAYINSRFVGLTQGGKDEEAAVFGNILEKARAKGLI